MVLNTCFVLWSSSFLLLAFRSAIPSTLSSRWRYIILDNFHSCFVIHMLSRMRYFKSINLFVELSCVKFHLKPSRRIVAIYGAYNDPSSSIILPVNKFVVSLLISIQSLVLLVAGCHLIIWDVFHKTISSLFFSLLVFSNNSVRPFS